jgi:heme/copper-type cytochrome/quinol oxidase subunit 2
MAITDGNDFWVVDMINFVITLGVIGVMFYMFVRYLELQKEVGQIQSKKIN